MRASPRSTAGTATAWRHWSSRSILGRGTTLTAPDLEEAAAAVTTRRRRSPTRTCRTGCASATSRTPSSAPSSARRVLRPDLPAAAGAPARQGAVAGALREPRRRGRRVRDVPPDPQVGAGPTGGRDRRCGRWSGDPATRLALLRRLVDFDLIGSVRLERRRRRRSAAALGGGPRAAADRGDLRQPLGPAGRPAARRCRTGPGARRATSSSRWSTPRAPWNEGRWRVRADEAGEADGGADDCRGRRTAARRGAGRCLPRGWQPARPAACRAGRRAAPRRGRASCGGPCAPTSRRPRPSGSEDRDTVRAGRPAAGPDHGIRPGRTGRGSSPCPRRRRSRARTSPRRRRRRRPPRCARSWEFEPKTRSTAVAVHLTSPVARSRPS